MNFEQKYLKYKSKYNQLKCQLKGGACNPPPNPNDLEHISLDQYANIPIARLETIGGHCYDIVQLGNWIHFAAVSSYPANGLPMSDRDKWNVITAYNAYRAAHDPALPNHFIFTPAQSAQIIAALANPPVPFAITNLIRNSIAALNQDSVEIKVIDISLRTIPDLVEFSIADSGPGFPMEWDAKGAMEDRIFTSTRTTGMGLGLYLVGATVENHRGTMSIRRSAELGGAEVILRFPLIS